MDSIVQGCGTMCRLLGVIANKPVEVRFSLSEAHRRFRDFGDYRNPDGWGMGWYEKGDTKVFKEGIPAVNSAELPRLANKARSKIMIVHVRKGTGAEPAERNSHPFKYQNWLFAHNGKVDRDYLCELLRKDYKGTLKGETDSEVYFYWILKNIEQHGDVVYGIKKAIGEVMKKDYTGLNFLLSDGERLYTFRQARQCQRKYSLYVVERDPSNAGPLELMSEETKALLQSKSLKGEKAVLICSEKLTTDEDWQEIRLGSLLEVGPSLEIGERRIC